MQPQFLSSNRFCTGYHLIFDDKEFSSAINHFCYLMNSIGKITALSHIQPVSQFPTSITNSWLFFMRAKHTILPVIKKHGSQCCAQNIKISTKITLTTSVLNLATGHSSVHPVTVGKQHAACIISAECRHCCNTTAANYHRHCNLKGNTMLAKMSHFLTTIYKLPSIIC